MTTLQLLYGHRRIQLKYFIWLLLSDPILVFFFTADSIPAAIKLHAVLFVTIWRTQR